jgi:hypothetical protein
VKADATKQLENKRNEADMQHGLSEFNVAKVSRTLGTVTATSLAFERFVRRPHAKIHQASILGDAILVGDCLVDTQTFRLFVINYRHAPLKEFFGGGRNKEYENAGTRQVFSTNKHNKKTHNFIGA